MHLCVWKRQKFLETKKWEIKLLVRIKELLPYYQFTFVNEINLPLSKHSIFKGDDRVLVKFAKTTGFTCLLEKPD